MKKENFEVGDKVRVVNSRRCYPHHSSMFKFMGFKNTKFNGCAPKGTVGTIFYIVQEDHVIFMGINYGEGKQTLINREGVELVKGESKPEEPIYRVGDTVYHHTFGKGTITEIDSPESLIRYPITVHFPKVGPKIPKTQYFRICGSENSLNLPTLSFTEYNLVDGGFSQVRPTLTIEIPNIQSKWKYLTKRGPTLTLWADIPQFVDSYYTLNGERSHVGNILKIEVEDGLYKIKR